MLFRFSLYGFLKNQRYFEPFLVLVLLDKGLSYTAIGSLIAFRELTINLLEVPTGAIADVCGRRASMILSFAAYIASFLTFAAAQRLWLLFPAMFLFGIGEAFRSGTHKAMIFTWLRLQGRQEERTRVYGFTRSWSQIGSAASVLIGGLFVFFSNSYTHVFYLATIPYFLNIINFLGYPKEVDGERLTQVSLAALARHTWTSLVEAVRRPALRRLVIESMGFEGVFDAAKDYLQPVLKAAALAAAAHWLAVDRFTETQKGAMLIGPVYFVIYLLTAVGSRQSHRLADRAGHEDRAARWLWIAAAVVYAGIAAAGCLRLMPALIFAFLLLHVLQNVWRPILIARFDSHADETQGATVLSIESQAQRLATMTFAPLLGLAVDAVKLRGIGGEFWPVGVVGLVAAIWVLGATARRAKSAGVEGSGVEGETR